MNIGDKIKLTTITHGEAVFDRKGKPIHMRPQKNVYVGIIKYIGPECPFPSCEVVRCSGGDIELKLDLGFSFYTKDIGKETTVEVLK